jgi:hypothetical protein
LFGLEAVDGKAETLCDYAHITTEVFFQTTTTESQEHTPIQHEEIFRDYRERKHTNDTNGTNTTTLPRTKQIKSP